MSTYTDISGFTPQQQDAFKAAAGSLNVAPSTYGYGPVVAPITPVPAAPAPTPHVDLSSVFGTLSPEEQNYQALGTSLYAGANATVDEAGIRANALKQLQAEIDATNSVYAGKLADAKILGANNLGSTLAGEFTQGVVGSNIGNAQYSNQQSANQTKYDAVEAARLAAIYAIQDKGNAAATAEIQAKNDAKRQSTSDYLGYLTQADARKKEKTTTAASALISAGIDPSQISSEELRGIASSYGIDPKALEASYLTAHSAQQKAAAEEARAQLTSDDNHLQTTATIQNQKDTQALSQKRFDEDVKQFGVTTAQRNREIAIQQQNANTSSSKLASDNKVLSIKDAQALGVPYGTTQSQAAALGRTPGGNTQVNALKTNAIATAQELLKKLDSGTSAVGLFGGLGAIPGSPKADFTAQFDHLHSLLSLDNVKYLKGQGSVSDSERTLLDNASGIADALKQTQSKEAFRASLEGLISTLQTETGQSDAGSPAKGTDGASYGFPGYHSDGTQWVQN